MWIFSSRISQYTRKARLCHVFLGLLVAAACLPASSAAEQPGQTPQVHRDVIHIDPWLDELEMYLWLWWDILEAWPPPTLPEDLALMCHEFNEGYATVGLIDLTPDERQEWAEVAQEVIDHLAIYPDLPTEEANKETSETFAAIHWELTRDPAEDSAE